MGEESSRKLNPTFRDLGSGFVALNYENQI